MKKLLLSIVILTSTAATQANNFNMPGFGNNNSGFNNGSSWNMPDMNWGNGQGQNAGSNWNMPNMNWGNNSNNNNSNNNANNNGSNWNMPNMNFGNNNSGNTNGSNWNMPNMNFGNNNNSNGSNWNMPNMNWGNGNNNVPWNFGGNNSNNMRPNFNYVPPNVQFMPTAPVQMKQQFKAPLVQTAPAVIQNKIPMPSEVKGTILAPANQPVKVEATTK